MTDTTKQIHGWNNTDVMRSCPQIVDIVGKNSVIFLILDKQVWQITLPRTLKLEMFQ